MARISILQFGDANLAGSDWTWSFYLNKTANGRFILNATQTVSEGSPMRIAARRGLRNGVDVYEALVETVEESGYSLDERDLPAIARRLAEIDPGLEPDFIKGKELSEAREELREPAE
jgi:hypothetical protein